MIDEKSFNKIASIVIIMFSFYFVISNDNIVMLLLLVLLLPMLLHGLAEIKSIKSRFNSLIKVLEAYQQLEEKKEAEK